MNDNHLQFAQSDSGGKILACLNTEYGRTSLNICEMTNLHINTVLTFLRQGVDIGLINKSGITRNAKYVLTDIGASAVLKLYISKPLNARPMTHYRPEWLDAYEPNQTFYLSSARRQKLHAICAPGSAPINAVSEVDIHNFLILFAWGSSKLEGNVYDEADTRQLIEHGIVRPNSDPIDTQMILNHAAAVKFAIEELRRMDRRLVLNESSVRQLHAILSSNLMSNPDDEGRLRILPVSIKGAHYEPPSIPQVLEHQFEKIISKGLEIADPYERAFFYHVHLPYLQPFMDVNKRTARMCANIALMQGGVLPITWSHADVSDYKSGILGVYECNDPTLMGEVFVDSYAKSTERFKDFQSRMHKINPIDIHYNMEIKGAVRQSVYEGTIDIPRSVQFEDVAAFRARVIEHLYFLLNNPIVCPRYGIKSEDVSESSIRALIDHLLEKQNQERGVAPKDKPSGC